MDAIRDLINSIGLKPEHFDLVVIGVVIVGGIWAIIRLFQDLTRPLENETDERDKEA